MAIRYFLSVLMVLKTPVRPWWIDPKLEKKVTFARLLNKVSAEMSSGSEVDIGTMAVSLICFKLSSQFSFYMLTHSIFVYDFINSLTLFIVYFFLL